MIDHELAQIALQYRPIAQLIPVQWTKTTVVANGIHQHVLRTGGNKPPLLLLHGFMESGFGWLRLARHLADRFDVIMPDARVHGQSERSGHGFNPDILCDDVLALVEALGLEQPIVMGHSNGAVTAFLVAVKRPEYVRALILEEPPAGGRPMPAVSQEVLASGNWYDEWMSWMRAIKTMPHTERMQSAAARWPHGMPIPPDEPLWPEDDFVGRAESLANFDLTIFDTNIKFWSLLDHLEHAPNITCPMLLLTGEPMLGTLVAEDVVLSMMEQIPQLQWQQIEGGSHILSRGRPFEQTLATLMKFLA